MPREKLALGNVKTGEVLQYWYDSGAFGYEICYASIVKIGAKKVKMRFENGCEAWKYLEFFHDRVDDKTVIALREEGVSV